MVNGQLPGEGEIAEPYHHCPAPCGCMHGMPPTIVSILVKSRCLELSENSHRICCKFAQNRPGAANIVFKRVC